MEDTVAMAVFMCFVWGCIGLWFLITIVVLICRRNSAEERAAAERTAALEAAYSLAQRRLAAVELMPPVVPASVAAPMQKKLGHFSYSVEARSASEYLECAICLGVFEHGEECSKVSACRHLFHRECISVWMKTNTSCPLCRRSIVAGSEVVSAADDMV